MEIEINVSGGVESMTQANSQRVKRCSNVLIEAGFKVKINWDCEVKSFEPIIK